MVSQSRSASARASRSARGTSGTRRSAGGNARSARTDATRKPAARHNGGGSHRSYGSKGPKPKGRKKHLILKWFLGIVAVCIAAGVGAFAYLYITTEVPQPEKFALAEKTTVYYADGTTTLGSFAEQNREIIECKNLPDYVGKAIVASEDRTFYTNRGIDLKGIARALVNNITKGTRQGGSTITQQYAERYYLGETTSYTGKLREAILAVKIAQQQDKSEVLCNYMNTIYLGRGSYGIQAAAQAYFGKDAKDLSLAEAATIAGIIPAPSTWDPAQNPDMATQRMQRVLRIMKEDGYITADEQAQAKTLPATVEYTQNNVYSGPNGYLLTTVENELINSGTFTKDDLETGGYKIITTIDKTMQDEMQTVGDTRPDGMPESIQVGGIALDPRDGTVKAIYGGSDYLTHQLNNATQAQFQPGSTMKPFALLGAAQEGVNFNTMFNGNSGQHFNGISEVVNNALNNNWGNINLYQATANSVNTVFMNVNEHLTPQRTAAIAHEAGITSDIDADSPYNVLGINASTVWDLAQGHATIAANGVKNTLHIVATVNDGKGNEVYKTAIKNEKVFDANDCALVQKAMQGTTTNGTAAGTAAALSRAVAGKSGTANDQTAASFVGYVPQLLNVWAIWNPGDDGSSQVVPEFAGYGISSTGYPAHLFTEFMSQALSGQEVIDFPTATDNGKIGGSDGTWGLGSAYTKQQEAQKKAEEDAKKQAEEDAKKQADEDAQKKAQQDEETQFQQQCAANAQYSPQCPGYKDPAATDTGNDSGAGDGTGTGGNSGDSGSTGGTGGTGSDSGSDGSNNSTTTPDTANSTTTQNQQ